jgi:hypothetical protein
VLISPLFIGNTYYSIAFVYSCIFLFRIPLIPRRTASPEAGSKAKGEKTKAGKGAQKDAGMDDSPGPQDVDEKLLIDAHLMAVGAVDKTVSCI